MHKYTLLIDMDSVITNLMKKWFDVYNKDYNDNLMVSRLLNWNTHDFVRKECNRKIYEYLEQPDFYRDLEPIPYSIEVLERLHKKYEIFIVTTSPINALKDKAEWVKEYLPFIGSNRIIFTHFKERIQGDLLFDDAPHNLEKFYQTGRTAIAMDYPYNCSVNCERVSNWLEFEDSLEQWLEGELYEIL